MYMVEAMKFQGRVVRGKREGTKIGFPTANIEVGKKIEPGIYTGFTSILKTGPHDLPSMFYIAQNSQVIESHILDFQAADLYGREISVNLKYKIRDVQVFNNLETAKEQISRDEKLARKWFQDYSN